MEMTWKLIKNSKTKKILDFLDSNSAYFKILKIYDYVA